MPRTLPPRALAALLALAAALPARAQPSPPSSLVPADAPLVAWVGRTQRPLSLRGGVAFDWEGVSATVSVGGGATSVVATLALAPGNSLKLRVTVDGVDAGAVLVAGAPQPVEVVLASGLAPASAHVVRATSAVEPMHIYGAAAAPRVPPALLSFATDGAFLPPPPPSAARTMLVVGDSITAGSGSVGVPPCAGDINTTDVTVAYGSLLAANFSAQLLGNIAVSGIGVFANCCDDGPTMAQIEKQTLGGVPSADADHNDPTRPQLVLLGLGTNDFFRHSAANATFVDAFVRAYVDFVVDLVVNRLSAGPQAIFLLVGPITDVYGPAVARVAAQTVALGLPVGVVNVMGAPLDGCASHPGVRGHRAMAEAARPFIAAAMGWGGAGEGAGGADGEGAEATVPRARAVSPALLARGAAVAAARLAAADSAAAAAAAARATLRRHLRDVVLTVRSDGSGNFSSVQAALDSLDPSDPALGHVTLRLLGTFRERVEIVPAFSGGVTLAGDGAAATDALVVFNRSGAAFTTWHSWTLRVGAADVTLDNVAVANDAAGYDADVAGQSVALHVAVTADRFACVGCALFGGQDTLYTGGAGYGLRSWFERALVNGTVDSVFGGSSTVFQSSTLAVSSTATAPRGEPSSAYLFLNCSVRGLPGRGGTLLGRPWGQLSTAVFRDAELAAAVQPAGWADFGHECDTTNWCAPVLFAEAASTGAGADPAGRVKWSRQLNASAAAEWTAERVLRGWVPPRAR